MHDNKKKIKCSRDLLLKKGKCCGWSTTRLDRTWFDSDVACATSSIASAQHVGCRLAIRF